MVVEIDGSTGGGQILRSALALAGITGEAVRVEDVRGNRPNPGLKHQHIACVDAAAAICDADVDGAELGNETVAFAPGNPTGGDVTVDVGTAGAVTLVFETVLPLSVAVDEPFALTATGGTDVAWSPTVDYYEYVRLPLARAFGWRASLDVSRRGFYPGGGGEATVRVEPGTPERATLTERGSRCAARVSAVATSDLADADVPRRMHDAALDALEDADVDVVETEHAVVDSRSTGASVVVCLDHGAGVAGFGALGERGKPAEDVGLEATADALAFWTGDRSASDASTDDASAANDARAKAPPVVDRYAADQLVLPLALAGGRVRPAAVTEHVWTNCAIARAFGYDVRVEDDVLVG